MSENNQVTKIEALLEQYAGCREELIKYIHEVEETTSHVKDLFPKNLDFRTSRYLLEDKLKTVSTLYNVLLNWRQEYIKSVKDEIEMRRKMVESGEQTVDIRAVAERIESLRNLKNEIILPELKKPQGETENASGNRSRSVEEAADGDEDFDGTGELG